MKKLHGVHLAHHKNTENSASVPLPLPKLVRIPMSCISVHPVHLL